MPLVKIVSTEDGSDTIYSTKYNAYYHSTKGAIQESLHVFIKNGLEVLDLKKINILEIGFGTGLNAALTAARAKNSCCYIKYTGIDKSPLDKEILSKLNFNSFIDFLEEKDWNGIANAEWDREESINEFFILNKINADFLEFELKGNYNLVYYDAFAPDDQPEMWTLNAFEKLYKNIEPNGILVTYCSKGIVKQALREVGFDVKRLLGPPGKRHMIRAMKK